MGVIRLVVGSGAALAVSTMSSTTRGDFVFGFVSWLMFVVSATVVGGVVLSLVLGLTRLRGQPPAELGRVTAAALLVGMAAAFPVGAEWDEEGYRASGLVPAAQALVTPIWPRAANADRPLPPVVGYAYTCCG
jgi:hypothetical protein